MKTDLVTAFRAEGRSHLRQSRWLGSTETTDAFVLAGEKRLLGENGTHSLRVNPPSCGDVRRWTGDAVEMFLEICAAMEETEVTSI